MDDRAANAAVFDEQIRAATDDADRNRGGAQMRTTSAKAASLQGSIQYCAGPPMSQVVWRFIGS
jgi:hypothetical protein